eukprot:TRINITY_DN6304_c0_g1_i1.p1 TRINITY_DN6304_c0_g1~~TRINITY_DN6304_c0_g1_i1.p1  ORF type:complete len:104 (+),score=15.61 TRINITY_DN6304_c0_g1_i1:243-554(+)
MDRGDIHCFVSLLFESLPAENFFEFVDSLAGRSGNCPSSSRLEIVEGDQGIDKVESWMRNVFRLLGTSSVLSHFFTLLTSYGTPFSAILGSSRQGFICCISVV